MRYRATLTTTPPERRRITLSAKDLSPTELEGLMKLAEKHGQTLAETLSAHLTDAINTAAARGEIMFAMGTATCSKGRYEDLFTNLPTSINIGCIETLTVELIDDETATVE